MYCLISGGERYEIVHDRHFPPVSMTIPRTTAALTLLAVGLESGISVAFPGISLESHVNGTQIPSALRGRLPHAFHRKTLEDMRERGR
jgi:hypothetical protein